MEIDEYREKILGYEEQNKVLKERLKKYCDEVIEALVEDFRSSSNRFEEHLIELLWTEYRIDHKDYGVRLEYIIRKLIKELFKSEDYEISGPKQNIGDILIKNKTGSIVVVEVKSFISDCKSDKNQNFDYFIIRDKNIKENGYKGYFLFAGATPNSKRGTDRVMLKWNTSKYKQQIALQSFYNGNDWEEIWKYPGLNDYKPFTELINNIIKAFEGKL